MKKPLLAGVLITAVVLVALIVFGPKSDPSPEPSGGEPAAEAPPSPAPAKVAERAPEADPVTSTPGEEIEAPEPAPMDPMIQSIVNRLKGSHDKLRDDLADKLGLDANQTARLDAALEARRAQLAEWLSGGAELTDSEEGMRKIGALVRGEGLRDALEEFLTDEQLADYDKREEAEWERRVEGRAYKELAKITPVLELTQDQKDEVFAAVYDASDAKLKEEQDQRAFMSMFTGQPADQIEMNDMGLARLMMEAEASGDIGSDQFMQKLEEVETQRIDAEVARLESILTEEQAESYRKHLHSTSMISQIKARMGQ